MLHNMVMVMIELYIKLIFRMFNMHHKLNETTFWVL